MWQEIDWSFMSEESDDDDDGSINRHKLPWRSKSKCMYVSCQFFTNSLCQVYNIIVK